MVHTSPFRVASKEILCEVPVHWLSLVFGAVSVLMSWVTTTQTAAKVAAVRADVAGCWVHNEIGIGGRLEVGGSWGILGHDGFGSGGHSGMNGSSWGWGSGALVRLVFLQPLDDHPVELRVGIRNLPGSLDCCLVKFMELVELGSLGDQHRHVGVSIQLVLGDASLHFLRQSRLEIVGQCEAPKSRVIGKDWHLQQVLLEQIVNTTGDSLTTELVDDAKAVEEIRNLMDHFWASDSIRANIIQAQDGGKEIKLAAAHESSNAVGDGVGTLVVTGGAIILQRQNRRGKHGVKGGLIIQEVQVPEVGG